MPVPRRRDSRFLFFLKEKLAWNHLVEFVFLAVAAFFAFAFKTPAAAS